MGEPGGPQEGQGNDPIGSRPGIKNATCSASSQMLALGGAQSSRQPCLTRDPEQGFHKTEGPVVQGVGRGYQLQPPLENHGHVGVLKALTSPAGNHLLHCVQLSVSWLLILLN